MRSIFFVVALTVVLAVGCVPQGNTTPAPAPVVAAKAAAPASAPVVDKNVVRRNIEALNSRDIHISRAAALMLEANEADFSEVVVEDFILNKDLRLKKAGVKLLIDYGRERAVEKMRVIKADSSSYDADTRVAAENVLLGMLRGASEGRLTKLEYSRVAIKAAAENAETKAKEALDKASTAVETANRADLSSVYAVAVAESASADNVLAQERIAELGAKICQLKKELASAKEASRKEIETLTSYLNISSSTSASRTTGLEAAQRLLDRRVTDQTRVLADRISALEIQRATLAATATRVVGDERHYCINGNWHYYSRPRMRWLSRD